MTQFEALASHANEDLRMLWKATQSPETRNVLERIASALDAIEGDRQFLLEALATDEQADYRKAILAY